MQSTPNARAFHSFHSTLRERIVEHIFVGEVLRWFWNHEIADVEVLRSEFDAGGYDLVMSYKKLDRHIQFKTTVVGGKADSVNASLKLMNKPGGCIIWIFVTEALELHSYRWLGGIPGEQLPDIRGLKDAKHTKGDANGNKAKKPQHRIVPIGNFDQPCSFDELMEKLFGKLS